MKKSLLIFALCLFFPLEVLSYDDGGPIEWDGEFIEGDIEWDGGFIEGDIDEVTIINQYNKGTWKDTYCVMGNRICVPSPFTSKWGVLPTRCSISSVFPDTPIDIVKQWEREGTIAFINGVPSDNCPSVDYAQTKSNTRYIAQNSQLVPAPRKTPQPQMRGEVRIPEWFAVYGRYIAKTIAVDANNWDERYYADRLFVATSFNEYREPQNTLPGYEDLEDGEVVRVSDKTKECYECYEAKLDYNKTGGDTNLYGFHLAEINGITVTCKTSTNATQDPGRCIGE